MAEINSPLGRKVISNPVANRVLTIPDATELSSEENDQIENNLAQVQAARQAALESKRKASPSAKERIAYLTGLGRARCEVEFEGIVFGLQSMKSQEVHRVLLAGAQGANRVDSAYLVRNHTIAHALEKIDGQPIELVIGSNSYDAKLALINDMDEELVEFLNKNYEKMMMANRKKFVIETPEQAKEVAEDLKK